MMITQVRRIGLFRRLDMILGLADEEEKRSNFRTPRLQLPNVVFCFSEKFQIPGFIGNPPSGIHQKISYKTGGEMLTPRHKFSFSIPLLLNVILEFRSVVSPGFPVASDFQFLTP
jgi:hypothetical protein